MRTQELRRLWSEVRVLLIMLALALLASCGAGRSAPSLARGDVVTTSSDHPHYVQDLATALAELDALECPEAADPRVFAQIRENTRRMLIDKYSAKRVSDYDPTNDYVKVREFDWDPGGTYGKLAWVYVNDGDYNQDSGVTALDISPLAAHYGEEVTGANTIQELIDEDDEPEYEIVDGDGLVDGEQNERYDYNDADTIDFCWNTYVDHYSVQGASSPAGSWTEVDTVDFEDHDGANEGEARYRFHWDISTTSYAYFKVVPVGGPGTFPSSQHSEVIRLSPDVTSVTWSTSPKSGESSTATVHLADTDIPPVTGWSWNFGGGATPNTSNQEHPTVTFGRGDTYDAWVEVTNAFGTDHYDFDLVVQAQWHIETVDARSSICTSLGFAPGGNPGISYITENPDTLRYVKYDGDDWNEEFTLSPVYTNGAHGASTSLAYDSAGNPYVACVLGDFGSACLALMHRENGVWMHEIVNAADAGYSCSVALHPVSGDPGISYFQMIDDTEWLIYSHPLGERWLHDMVCPGWYDGYAVGTSLAFNPSNQPTISFYNLALMYAWYDGSQWTIDSVDSSPFAGSWSSLAYDAVGWPAISYLDFLHLEYAIRIGTTWYNWSVDEGGGVPVGFYTSLGFDGSGRPVVSYYDHDNGDLKAAWGCGLPPSWSIQIVDSSGNIGTWTSLAIDSYGCPGISYGGDDLRFAWWW